MCGIQVGTIVNKNNSLASIEQSASKKAAQSLKDERSAFFKGIHKNYKKFKPR